MGLQILVELGRDVSVVPIVFQPVECHFIVYGETLWWIGNGVALPDVWHVQGPTLRDLRSRHHVLALIGFLGISE